MFPSADPCARDDQTLGARKILRKQNRFTKSRSLFDGENGEVKVCLTAIGLAFGLMTPANAAMPLISNSGLGLAQAMVPPTGMEDDKKPMPMDERMLRRFPQPVRVGDLIGLPVLDDGSCTLGHVRQVVRTKEDQNRIDRLLRRLARLGRALRRRAD